MLQLIGWRLRQMVRDVPMMFWGLAFPIIMGIVIALGILVLLYSLIKRFIRYYKGS